MDKLTILYDGKCFMCENRVRHFLKLDKANVLTGQDYTQAEFDVSVYHLKMSDVDKYMHSIDSQGNVYQGIDTFIEIFKRIPKYKTLSRLLKLPLIKTIAQGFYHILAVYIRPRLPKRNCSKNVCQ
ncbi:MAG: hypothetical protein A2381_02050 [Bdellovibrionales bacterium RIFOXYB1_FULL_37_110]|nr:MAG: hypothetical protein A2417_13355 [Bdellovibrionales bacterium RIFOXYC1_FULL_37_79]OFZ53555.1 MAG: hypothetical protein A2328_11335 [Bdellovibrionales bacterium RIFOXYB2_FULL_36_6]OFZ59222.1 MAG: hypothetical protein A2381_02050 [Bdellovibrionales bacterium RIFOXYB1_FULL_37_110]OFZ62848.1 MAG: hypothetical protein A2577_11005 [Bdellovibrionales bacterium RIFOXYD1_FULL_36_51]